MKTLFKKYIRSNWWYINREPISLIAVIIFALIALAEITLRLINKI